ncbi:MAG: beta-lactamase family protein, partial [Clostridia bacterium]|nr:beta-lactamase family protein [Clostridia bacterium]
PGTHYWYSLSHDVLAAIAEVITGQTFEEYVSEWIFRPLGLTEIAYNFNESNRKKLIPQYMTTNGEAPLVPIGGENPYIFSKNYYSGGAGMIGRAEDYTRILSALSQGKLLKKETLELMKTNQLDETRLADLRKTPWLAGHGYGLGVRTLMDPAKVDYTAPVGEIGWDGAAGAFALVDSDRELAIGYFQQVRHCQYAYNVVHPKVRALVYEALGYTFK